MEYSETLKDNIATWLGKRGGLATRRIMQAAFHRHIPSAEALVAVLDEMEKVGTLEQIRVPVLNQRRVVNVNMVKLHE